MESKFNNEEKGIGTSENIYTRGLNTERFTSPKKTEEIVPNWSENVLLPQPMDKSFITRDGHYLQPLLWDKQRRQNWYRQRLLTPYGEIVKYHAEIEGIPPRLLATILLNELRDINADDVWQDQMAAEGSWLARHGFQVTSASIGIAQIQISTVERDRLLIINSEDYKAAGKWQDIPTWAYQAAIARKLTIPYWAIYAAAREIRILIEKILQHSNSEWQKLFGVNYPPIASAYHYEIYNCVTLNEHETSYLDGLGVSHERFLEAKVSNMIHAAYNSPDIIIAKQPGKPYSVGDQIGVSLDLSEVGSYPNARIMGWYAMSIANELYDMFALE